MMSVGTNTKNWGVAQEQRMPTEKGNKMSAAELEKLGDKEFGTVLNEIADPNYIDPAKAQQREKKGDLDKDAFFKLMLTQMKNQDPMNPMQSHEMAAHLAQFTSLEQMFNMNGHLKAIEQGQNPMKDYQALSFIGKEVSADSSMIVRNKEDASHELRFNLLGESTEAKIQIKNEAGETIRTLNVPELKKGTNSIRWDGVNDQGQKTSEGEYKFVVDAQNSSGKKIAVDTNASGRITGIQFTKKGPMLLIGSQQVYLSDVKKILDPSSQQPGNAPGNPQLPPGMSEATMSKLAAQLGQAQPNAAAMGKQAGKDLGNAIAGPVQPGQNMQMTMMRPAGQQAIAPEQQKEPQLKPEKKNEVAKDKNSSRPGRVL